MEAAAKSKKVGNADHIAQVQSANKKILLINYDFPPNAGIGGRRWAIFAKYLTRLGYEIHVLMRKPEPGSVSSFDVFVQGNERIIRHHLPSYYPKTLSTQPRTIIQKLRYRLWHKAMLLLSRGTPFDKTVIGSYFIRRKIRTLHRKESFTLMVVSGAPFRLCYYAARERDRLKVPLLIDLRDPWTWGKGYGFVALSERRKNYEKKMERFTLEKADCVTVPVEIMRENLCDHYPEWEQKFHLLPHGYDEEIISLHDGNRFKQSRVLRIVHFGTINDYIESEIDAIARVIGSYHGGIALTFYAASEKYKEIFEGAGVLNKFVFYRKQVSQQQVFEELGKYDFSLILHPEYGRNNFSTKIYETIFSGTPIMYIGSEGELSEFFQRTGSGIHIAPQEIEKELNPDKIRKSYNFVRTEEVAQFSYTELTQKLLAITGRR